MKDIFLKLMFNLHEHHNDLPFLPEIKKVNKAKSLSLTCKIKKEYIILKRNLQETLRNGLVLKKSHKVMKFNQKAYLKSYIYMNRELTKKRKKPF